MACARAHDQFTVEPGLMPHQRPSRPGCTKRAVHAHMHARTHVREEEEEGGFLHEELVLADCVIKRNVNSD